MRTIKPKHLFRLPRLGTLPPPRTTCDPLVTCRPSYRVDNGKTDNNVPYHLLEGYRAAACFFAFLILALCCFGPTAGWPRPARHFLHSPRHPTAVHTSTGTKFASYHVIHPDSRTSHQQHGDVSHKTTAMSLPHNFCILRATTPLPALRLPFGNTKSHRECQYHNWRR